MDIQELGVRSPSALDFHGIVSDSDTALEKFSCPSNPERVA